MLEICGDAGIFRNGGGVTQNGGGCFWNGGGVLNFSTNFDLGKS